MKTLRQLSASALLMLFLALPALAGDMQFPVVPPPAPPHTSSTMPQPNSTSVDAASDVEGAEVDPLTEVTLLILQGVLALF
jgi:hypothetical protein